MGRFRWNQKSNQRILQITKCINHIHKKPIYISLKTEPSDGALHRGAVYPMSKKPKTPSVFRKYLPRLWAPDRNTRNAIYVTISKNENNTNPYSKLLYIIHQGTFKIIL